MDTENTAQDPLAQLRKAVVSQKTAALPDHPADPSLEELHEKMVAYDRHVSETVIDVLSGGHSASPYPGADEITALLDRQTGGPGNTLAIYRRYKERLDRMLALAIEVAKTRQ